MSAKPARQRCWQRYSTSGRENCQCDCLGWPLSSSCVREIGCVHSMPNEVWTLDSTAPTLLFIDWDAVKDEETLQVTLQLDE